MTRELSKIELFCDDDSVGRIQRVLAQIKGVYDVKTVPVVNARAKPNGKVEAVTDGSVMELFAGFLAGKQRVTPKEIQDWLEGQGRSRISSSYIARTATKARLLTRRGKGSATFYLVRS